MPLGGGVTERPSERAKGATPARARDDRWKAPWSSRKPSAFAGGRWNGDLGQHVRPTAAPLRQGNLARWTTRGAVEALQASTATCRRQRDARLPSKEGSSQNAQKAASPSLQDSRSVAASWLESSKGLCCTATCSTPLEGSGGRGKPASTVLPTARCPRRSCLAKARHGFVTANAGGFQASQGERGLEAGAEAISWMCPYAVCLIAEVDRRSGNGSEKPFSHYVAPRKRSGRHGGREPRSTDVSNRSQYGPLFHAARLIERDSSLRRKTWRREP